MNSLEQQIRDDLAHVHEQPVPGERDVYLQDTQHEALRDAILLVARHVQRHDVLVTLQRDIDGYCEDRRMPDDALDSFEAQRDALRREIWEEVAILHLAKEAEAGEKHVTLDPAHKGRVARTPDGAPWVPAERYDELVARYMAAKDAYRALSDTLTERTDALGTLDKRNHELEAEIAEYRRHVATVMRREDVLKKRVEELEHERYVSRVKGWADEYDRVADVVREYNERED